jgi:hypothetical protein
MADFSVTPVATQIKPMPTMSLGEMINFARGAQQYQREGISLTKEQQEEAERKRVIEFMARPENFQSDGRIDINKLNAEIPKIAPLTGGELIRKYSDLSTAQTQAERAIQDMTTSQREVVGSTLSAAGYLNIKDPKQYQGLLDNLEKQYPNNPSMKNLVSSFRTQLGMVTDPDTLPQLAINAGNQVMNPAAQRSAFAPQAGTISTGAATFPTTTRPSVAGETPSIEVGTKPLAIAQLPPGSRIVPTGRIGPDNRELMNAFGPNGDFIGTFSAGDLEAAAAGRLPTGPLTPTGQAAPVAAPAPAAPGVITTPNIQTRDLPPQSAPPLPPASEPAGLSSAYRTPVRIPAFETAESGNTYRTQAMAAREQVQPARNAVDNIRTIRQYLPLAQTGRYSEAIAGLQSVLGNVAGSKPEELAAAARDIIEKNIADLALQKNSALGGKFAADLAAVQNSLATAGKNPTAIAKVMDQLEPLMQHVANYSTGLERAIAKSPNSYYAKPEFDRAMNDAYDPLALRMKNAYDTGGRDGLTKWLKANNVNLTEQQMLLQKLQAYGRLVRGD